MHIPNNTLHQLLVERHLVEDEALADAQKKADREGRPLQHVILEDNLVDETTLTKKYADFAGFPFVELVPQEISTEVLNRIPERIARQYNAVVFKIDDQQVIHLAMDDPDDVQAVSFIEKEIGTNTVIYMATTSNILACLEIYRGDVNEELNEVIDVQREDDASTQQVSEADLAEDSPIAQTINLLLEYAIRSSASDIHIEPREEYVQVRYRIDGVLKEVNRLPRNVLAALVSRVKILSNLKIDERRVPQDGRFKIKVAGKQYALRVSTLPVTDGE
ncbi:Flp pilus assembly complex ATPase component TadA, partial [Candidatus Saccharibacteria bacterium]|nr:Flp pilus assembly complex ATPase component TadA [Candidatus Saccharibacteria bacterium]